MGDQPTPRPPIDPDTIGQFPALIVAEDTPEGARVAREVREPAGQTGLRLEIPADIARLRTADPALAASWQMSVRRAFVASFAAGYRAVGFARRTEGDRPRAEYLLVRE